MPLTALRFAFQENVDERRFGRLARLLTVIQLEIERESAELRPSVERMTDCAAFSSEAMENGEVPQHMSARIDALAEAGAQPRTAGLAGTADVICRQDEKRALAHCPFPWGVAPIRQLTAFTFLGAGVVFRCGLGS
jgi:hypothetical protein